MYYIYTRYARNTTADILDILDVQSTLLKEPKSNLSGIGHHRVSSVLTGYRRVSLGIIGYHWVSLGTTWNTARVAEPCLPEPSFHYRSMLRIHIGFRLGFLRFYAW